MLTKTSLICIDDIWGKISERKRYAINKNNWIEFLRFSVQSFISEYWYDIMINDYRPYLLEGPTELRTDGHNV